MQWILACVFGVGAVSLFPQLPSLTWLLPLLPVALAAGKYKPLRFWGGLCFGVIWAVFYGWSGVSRQLPERYENIDLDLVGRIVGLPATGNLRQRFTVEVIRLGLPQDEQINPPPHKIKLNWYDLQQPVQPGETWQLRVRLKRPHGFANPDLFDYETWLFRQGIGATGYVRNGEVNRRLREAAQSLPVERLRYRIYTQLKQRQELSYAPVLTALTIGERRGIGRELWQLFTATGTNHLFVISGLHVGFVALCWYSLIIGMGRWLPLGAPVVAVQQPAAFGAILAAALYSLLAGFGLPTQRALVMLALLLMGRILKRQLSLSFCLAVALLFVMLLDPLAMRAAGLWLSFGAVGALLLGFSGYTSGRGIWWKWGRPQWLVFVALGPLLLCLFGQFSLLSPLANVLAIPLIGLVVVPLCLAAGVLLWLCPPLADRLLGAADWLIGLLIQWLRLLSELPLSVIHLDPGFGALVCAGLGALLWLLPAGLPGRWLALICFLPLLAPSHSLPPGAFRALIFDVGQGLAVLVETRHHRLIYDVGASFGDQFNAADTVLLPYLRRRRIEYLDKILISHGDNDHAGALPYLLSALEDTEIISGASFAQNYPAPTEACASGRSWQWDGVTFLLMQAEPGYWNNENNRSCVLKVANGESSLLLTGDIEREAERSLIAQFAGQLRSDVMVAPHHGSRTSSSWAFLHRVRPSRVVFTNGYKNRFGHPKQEVVQRYRQLGALIMTSAEHGAVSLLAVPGSELQLQPFRPRRIGYWYGR